VGDKNAGWSAAAIISTASELVIFLSGILEGRLLSRGGLANATDRIKIVVSRCRSVALLSCLHV